MAKLRFSYGTMNSGKSTRLLTTAHNFEERGAETLIIKSSLDTRDGGEIKSRIGDGISKPCQLVDMTVNIFDYVVSLYEGKRYPQWIFVDEAQFLTEDQVDELGKIVDNLDIEVWCFGLRTDFKTKLFPGSKRLFEIADKIEELKSMCSCGRKNIFNARITKDGKIAVAGAQVEVGGEDKYIAICRKCYNERSKLNNNC